MKHRVIGIIGVLLLVLGVTLIILQLMAREKSVIGSIAGVSTPIVVGSMLCSVSLMLKRKKASDDPSDTPK